MAPHILLGEEAVTRIILVSTLVLLVGLPSLAAAGWWLVRRLLSR